MEGRGGLALGARESREEGRRRGQERRAGALAFGCLGRRQLPELLLWGVEKRFRSLAGSQLGCALGCAPRARKPPCALPHVLPEFQSSSLPSPASIPFPVPTPATTTCLHGTKSHGKGRLLEYLRLRSQESPQGQPRMWECLKHLRLWP